MSAKSQHKNIMLAVLGFAVVVVIVAVIGLIALDRDPDIIQGQVEVVSIVCQVRCLDVSSKSV